MDPNENWLIDDEKLSDIFFTISELNSRIGERLNDTFLEATSQSLPYGRWLSAFSVISVSLFRYQSLFQPQLNQLALIPNHWLAFNPLTGLPEANLVPNLLYAIYPSDVLEEQRGLLKYFDSSYPMPPDQDEVQLRDRLNAKLDDFNAHIQTTLYEAHTCYPKPVEYHSTQTFGTVLSGRLKKKPKDTGTLEAVLKAIASGDGYGIS